MASQVIAYLEAIVGADVTSFRSGMAEVRGEITETAGLGESLAAIGTALTVGLVVAGGVGLKVFSDFDASMRNVNSIMQLSEDQFKALSDQVLKFGENTRNGAQGASEALYTIVSAGFGINNTAEAMKLLDVATTGAEAGLADTNTVAQTLAQSLLAYGKNADSAQHFMDVLTQTVNLGVGSMNDVTSAIGQSINTAAIAGVSWDDLGSSMAFLTQRGMSFANASVSINGILSQLIKPTEGLKAAYKDLGVASGTELIAKFGGLGGALQALGKSAGTSAEDLGSLFTNIRAFRGAASILENFGDYSKLMDQFGNSLDGVTGRAWLQQAKSFASQLDYIKSNVLGFLTSVGEDIKDFLKPAIDTFADFTSGLTQLDDQSVKNIVTIGLIIIAITALTFVVGFLLSSALTPLIIVVGLLASAWSNNFLGIQDDVNEAIPNIQRGFEQLMSSLSLLAFQVGYYAQSIVTVLSQYLGEDLKELLHDVFVGNWQKAQFDIEQIWIDLGRMFHDKLQQPIEDAFNTFIANMKQKVGDLLSAFSPDKFTAIAVAFVAIAAAITVFALPTLISTLANAFLTLSANIALALGIGGGGGLIGLLVVAAPLVIVIALIIGLVIAWQTNFRGLKDRTDELRGSLEKTLTTLKQLVVLTAYFTGGQDAAKNALNDLFGITSPDMPASNQGLGGSILSLGLGTIGSSAAIGGTINTPSISANPYSSPDPTGSRIQAGQQNNITIVSNDPNYIMNSMRRVGVDLRSRTQG